MSAGMLFVTPLSERKRSLDRGYGWMFGPRPSLCCTLGQLQTVHATATTKPQLSGVTIRPLGVPNQ